jgi:hypothetical protein
MKRLAMLLVSVFVFSIVFSCISAVNARSIPHEDPSAAQSSVDSLSFLSQYAQVFGLVASEQYTNASRLSQQLSLISVPADLSYILNRYNNLTQQFIDTLSELQTTLDNASSLLGQNRLDEAATNLNKAGVLVSQAEILLSSLHDATTTLSQQLGVLAAPAESQIAQAYNSLQSALQRLTDLINQYHTMMQNINSAKQNKAQQLQPTTLTLNLSTTNASVGGSIYASGALTSKGQVLPNRQISLLIDGLKVASATTGSAGSFTAVMTVPYNYRHVMTTLAIYTPAGADGNHYIAALSPPLKLNVNFYNTIINCSIPDVAYPGLPLNVDGSVTSQTGIALSGRTIKIQLDGNVLDQVQSDSNGIFFIQDVTNSQTTIGSHNVKIGVDPSGIYAGVEQQKTINVKQMGSAINVQVPSLVWLPSQIQIKGVVKTLSGPLNNANVTVYFDSANAVTQTLVDGSFNVTFNVPLNANLGGFQSLNVKVQPQEPWQSPTQKQTSVLVLNTVGLTAALVSSGSVIGIAYTRILKTKPKKESKDAFREENPQHLAEAPELQLRSSFQTTLAGPKGKLLETYKKSLQIVETTTGASIKQEMTLSEFLQESKPNLNDATVPFSELTRMTERALYSLYVPEEQDISKAETLQEEIRKMLEK